MRWASNVARMGESRGVYRVLMGKREEKRPLGKDPVIDGRILKYIFNKGDVGAENNIKIYL